MIINSGFFPVYLRFALHAFPSRVITGDSVVSDRHPPGFHVSLKLFRVGWEAVFMTLLTHPDFGVQFLRWFIFLVFLMIEILLTWMKLMGKPTKYDLKLHQYKLRQVKEIEQSVNQDDELFKIKKQSALNLAVEKEKQRREVELENHKKILNNIAENKNSISIVLLDEWEEKVKKTQKLMTSLLR